MFPLCHFSTWNNVEIPFPFRLLLPLTIFPGYDGVISSFPSLFFLFSLLDPRSFSVRCKRSPLRPFLTLFSSEHFAPPKFHLHIVLHYFIRILSLDLTAYVLLFLVSSSPRRCLPHYVFCSSPPMHPIALFSSWTKHRCLRERLAPFPLGLSRCFRWNV